MGRIHLREAIGFQYLPAKLLNQVLGGIAIFIQSWQVAGMQNVGSHAQRTGSFAGDQSMIAGNHLNRNTIPVRLFDRVLRVWTRRVQKAENACHFPFVAHSFGYSQTTNSSFAESSNFCVEVFSELCIHVIISGAPLVTLKTSPEGS